MEPHAELVAKTLAWEFESRKSVEVQTRTAIHNPAIVAGAKGSFDTMSEHYIETAAGRRFLEFQGLKGDKIVTRSSHYGDGTKFTDIDYRLDDLETQNAIFINRQFWMEDRNDRRQVPSPLLYLYAGREPLHEALPKATYLGEGKVIGRDCSLFLFPQVRWAVVQDQVFHLDKATAIPLKVEAFRDGPARESNQPMWTWTAQSLDEVQGRFVPLKSSQVAYDKDGAQNMSWDIEVKSIEFNKDYPASTFQPVIQPGVTVLDSFKNKVSTTPGERKPDIQKETTATAQPVYADPPRDWSTTASTASLVLGGAVLIAGVLLWWRRG